MSWKHELLSNIAVKPGVIFCAIYSDKQGAEPGYAFGTDWTIYDHNTTTFHTSYFLVLLLLCMS